MEGIDRFVTVGVRLWSVSGAGYSYGSNTIWRTIYPWVWLE